MLEHFDVDYEYRIVSPHETPRELLGILEEYEDEVIILADEAETPDSCRFWDANKC